MTAGLPSSRRRYAEYRRSRTARRGAGRGGAGQGADRGDRAERGGRRRGRSFGRLFVEFWGLLRGYRGRVGLCLATVTGASAMALVMPALTKVAIDYVILDTPGPEGLPAWLAWRTREGLLWAIGGVMLGATVLSIAVGMWGRWQMTVLTKRVQVLMRRRVFDHSVRLPLHRVYAIKSGGVASILREDAGGAGELLFHMMYNPWRAIVQLAGTLAVLAWVDWRMLAGGLALIPTIWLTHRTWVSRIRPVFQDIRATRQGIDAHATEAFGGMRVVRGFSREGGEAGRFVRGSHYMTRQEMLAWWWSRGIDIAWQLLVPAASVAVLVYGGRAVIRGELTIGDVMMFSAYLLMLLGPLEMLATSATELQNKLAGLDRVLDVLGEAREFEGTPAGTVVTARMTRGRITLRDVWFSYPARTRARWARDDGEALAAAPTIRGVSLDVSPGETIALVGPSGSGKTTLCNLIARFYDPQQGAILLDGVDLREIDVESYRRLLGIVEQDVFLFDGTVAQNIAYARREATHEQIAEAARLANSDGFIEKLDQGYDTLIGERGVRLSGGQKQRLAIARALLADPRILILDEATSNLDTESERLIQASLSRLMRGRTSFVIAHRLSTIRHADRIVVLEDGQITEEGSHEELLSSGGRYSELLRMQLEPAEEPRPEDAPVGGGEEE